MHGKFNHTRFIVLGVVLIVLSLALNAAWAADWPMWRHDPARTAVTPEKLPDELHLQWVREYPPLQPAFWQTRQERVQFDQGYEPVVLGKTMLVGSSRNDSLTALDTETGAEKWRFYADGPVRFAPAAAGDRLFFVSDDGYLYCLKIDSGKLLWKVRGAPSQRKVLGNGRLISVWPARGGPVVADGQVYFAAGLWPFEGIFVHARDASSGKEVWINDRTGSMYWEHPHAAMAFGGPVPQGYLLIQGDKLVVPCSRAFPAFFDLKTGALASLDFGHGGHGSRPGAWFVCCNSAGELCVDPEINNEIHDAGLQVIGQSGVRRKPSEELQKTVTVGEKVYRVEPGVASTIRVDGKERRYADIRSVGTIHTRLAADGKEFLVTRSGQIRCLRPSPDTTRWHRLATQPLARPDDSWGDKAKDILARTGQKQGYGLVWGLQSGRLAEELALQSELHLVAIAADAGKVDVLRRRWDAAGLYGQRIAIHQGNPLDFGLPPFLAKLIVCEDLQAAGIASGEVFWQAAFRVLHPYGGTLCLEASKTDEERIAAWLKQPAFAGAEMKREGDLLLVVRSGPPAGGAEYTGLANGDDLVRAPLGLLWFGDTVHHHKLFYKGFTYEAGRGLPTTFQVVEGVLKYLVAKEPCGPNPTAIGYVEYLRQLTEKKSYLEAQVDVYTGRVLQQIEPRTAHPTASDSRASDTAASDRSVPPQPPGAVGRRNPITGIQEAREYLKSHGCDQFAVDYGNLLTMRSGTAAFYDKRLESGTINISGIRSGCRNSIVPACGVLNLPSWTGNCTCNYPLFTSLALVRMAPEFEQWTAWGGVAIEAPVRRVGINFGAPGDRVAEDGTLWLDWPSVGGPSPNVPVQVLPENAQPYYRHSLWMQGGQGWPWVFASGLKGVRSVRVETVARRCSATGNGFSVRWTGTLRPEFTETYTFHAPGDPGFRLWLDERLLLDSTIKRRGNSVEVSASVPLTAGQPYRLRAEYGGLRSAKPDLSGRIELQWSSPSVPKQIVPAERFSTPDGKPGGLAAAYYDNGQCSGPAAIQVDPRISFDWTQQPPAAVRRCRTPGQAVEQSYRVRLAFAEPEAIQVGQRVFSVRVQGREVLKDFDVLKEAGVVDRGLVREFRGVRAKEAVTIEFAPSAEKPPLICGVELIAEDRAE